MGTTDNKSALLQVNGLEPNKPQAIIWINDDQVHWHMNMPHQPPLAPFT